MTNCAEATSSGTGRSAFRGASASRRPSPRLHDGPGTAVRTHYLGQAVHGLDQRDAGGGRTSLPRATE